MDLGALHGDRTRLDFGTQIVFSFGPLGLLEFPGAYVVDLGRLAFLWSGAVQVLFCVSLLWCSRRAFGLPFGLVIALFTAAMPSSDRILIVATVVGAAALLSDWSSRTRLALATGAGALCGMQLLASLRAGPTLLVRALVVLAALPDRRRTLPAFGASMALSFLVFWFATGQGLGNLADYATNVASVLSGYSSSMVYLFPARWWQIPALVVGVIVVAALCAAVVWRRDTARRIALPLLVGAVVFLMFKHAVVRYSPGSAGAFLVALLAVGLALAPYVRRAIAIGAVVVLAGLAYLGNDTALDSTFDFPTHAETFVQELKIVATPGRRRGGAGGARGDAGSFCPEPEPAGAAAFRQRSRRLAGNRRRLCLRTRLGPAARLPAVHRLYRAPRPAERGEARLEYSARSDPLGERAGGRPHVRRRSSLPRHHRHPRAGLGPSGRDDSDVLSLPGRAVG